MTDSSHAERQLGRLARVRDEELAGIGSRPAARLLLASIVAEEVPPPTPTPRPRVVRRLALATAVVVAITAAVVIGPGLLDEGPGTATSYANSAIDVRREGDYFVARIKDPLADRAKYVEAFRAVGKDVEIVLVPVSPPFVGDLLEVYADANGGNARASTELESSGPEPVDCARQPADCTMVIRISVDTTGTVRYKFGRVARPGETPQDPSDSLGDGTGEASAGGGD